ncbi:hypothetical protein KJ978_02935 [Patescibacteria group bacterium]|nr:hypothetical protein [Patescibacteria group bacterium]MBU1421408.1 hypothetical protein [Patescibacteria group bacterium]MBU2456487.1 hypothetical protein [Patescibacteria group bacterium]
MQNNNNKKLNLNDFFKLPIKKQEEIMSEVAGEANKDQQALVKRYNKQFGKTGTAGDF